MYAIGAFLSPFLERYHGQTTGQAGNISGINYCFGGLGILLGGWACDWLGRRRVSGRLEVCTVALAVGGPCIYMALQQPKDHPWAFAAWLVPGCLMFYVYYAGVYATIQDVVEPARRGAAMGLYFLAMYFLGAAAGPVITGWLSDRYSRSAAAAENTLPFISDSARATGLHDAMYIIPTLAAVLVVVLFAASRTVTRDYQNLQRWIVATTRDV
jgi:MFS family permease